MRVAEAVTEVCGDDWGPYPAAAVAREIEEASATYYVGTAQDPVELLPELTGDVVTLTARADNGADQLLTQPDCLPR
jgi:hypothetical protein